MHTLQPLSAISVMPRSLAATRISVFLQTIVEEPSGNPLRIFCCVAT